MSDFDIECLVTPKVDSGESRKRKRNINNWDKTKRKFARNSAASHNNPHVSCRHKQNKTCCVERLDPQDIADFHEKLYRNKSKVDQDNFLLNYIQSKEPNRSRPRSANPRSRIMADYFVRKINGTLVRVCAQTFSSITGISRFRINGINKSFKSTGEIRIEKRGGSRLKKKDTEVTDSIVQCIQTLKCRESHYGRAKSVRVYMDPELSVKKIWKLWQRNSLQNSKPVASYSKFYNIFQTRFNIGFGSPKTDACSFCEECTVKIKKSKSPAEKADIMGLHRMHKLRAKRFYELLKNQNDNDCVTVSFDMQQNQPLPMIRISETFYARQIWLYNLTFVIHEDKQSVGNTFIYTWTENQSARGSNEVVSALHNFLYKLEEKIKNRAESENVALPTKLRLFSDATSSQNKNSTMMGFLLHYVQRNTTICKEITHYFPIRGHSFMPPDRIFGRIEKMYRKKKEILSPHDYHTILNEHGTLKVLGQDWQVLNFKKCADIIIRKKLPFSMREQRVFVYKKGSSKVWVRNTYDGDENKHQIQKMNMMNTWKKCYQCVNIVNEKNKISVKKKNDVEKLLKFVSLSEEAKNFYNQALQNTTNDPSVVDHTEVYYDEEEPFV